MKQTTMLKKGDVIKLEKGMKVYSELPLHYVYENCKGIFNETTHADVTIEGEFSYLAGRYIVYRTKTDGGGYGHGPHDVFPDGHHVFARKMNDPRVKVDFYQTGCFTAMLPDLKPIKS